MGFVVSFPRAYFLIAYKLLEFYLNKSQKLNVVLL